ncbi:MAG: hypothetical protein KDA27_20555 [Candidatus Eisenbacteria bacterium]|uniref:Uncharacterized protein n=1 Tax=Eiseniibacteriota bacterium TaxID=2212470 RepID=A0A956SH94_UNCEI|nr:hypothetical protein [Candidatus Eisenbacteria bacterium]
MLRGPGERGVEFTLDAVVDAALGLGGLPMWESTLAAQWEALSTWLFPAICAPPIE